VGLFSIDSNDGEGVRKPEYVALREAIGGDDYMVVGTAYSGGIAEHVPVILIFLVLLRMSSVKRR
jgi:hypothetical protein